MMLPPELQQRVQQELERVDRSRLAAASQRLSENYRAGKFAGSLSSTEERAAYLLARLPATFAANHFVLDELARRMPEFAPKSLLDVGAGPGTATWAARQRWPGISQAVLIEANEDFLRLGQRLAANQPGLDWRNQNVAGMELPSSDLVVMSYALGEMKNPLRVIERAWAATRSVLVILEPGTPRNFAFVTEARERLISAGAQVAAPCPHENGCPMAAAADWCHFAVRLERSTEHRRLKGGALGYEDEKFSYLAFTRGTVDGAKERIVRHPAIHGGHIQITLCTREGLASRTVTKSQKELFRAARNAKWGDAWEPED
jgi:ribosomal protein RSM22 (predicted rRNA methylase)